MSWLQGSLEAADFSLKKFFLQVSLIYFFAYLEGIHYHIHTYTFFLPLVGSDYIALDEVFTFNSEVTRVFFNITILNDDILEQIETFGLAAEAVSDFDIDVRLPELSIIQIGESDDLSSQFQSRKYIIWF